MLLGRREGNNISVGRLFGAEKNEQSSSMGRRVSFSVEKDMRLALALGDVHAVPMPVTAAANECDELVEDGASVGETPAAVVKKYKYTIGMLSDPTAALSVVFDKDGILEQICGGKGYIDMSTVGAYTSSKISEAITSKGGYFVEAPVSGSKKPAEDGHLVILAAGEKALYEDILPAFDVLGKKSFFLGQVGNGAKMKLVVNMIMGSMINAFSEGLVLADKTGLNPQTLLDVLDLSAIANPMFRMKGPTMIQNNYAPAFPLKHQHKDMRLALALGDVHAVPMPVAAAANEHSNKSRVCQPLEGLSDDEYISDWEYCDGQESDRREPEIFCRHLDHVNACGLNKTSLRLRFLLLTLQDATYLLLSAKRHDGFFSTWPKELYVLAKDQSAQNRSMMGIANISGSSRAMSFYCR